MVFFVCSLAAFLGILYLAAFLSALCLDASISSYELIMHQPRLQDLGLRAPCQMHDVLTRTMSSLVSCC